MNNHSQYVQNFLENCPSRFRRAFNTLELCLDRKTDTIENCQGVFEEVQEFSDTYDLGITIRNVDTMLDRGREQRVVIEFDTQIIESKLNSIPRLRRQRNEYKARTEILEGMVEQLKARVDELESIKIKVSDPENTGTSMVKIQVSDPEINIKNPANIQVSDPETDTNDTAKIQVSDPEPDHDNFTGHNTVNSQVSDPTTNHETADKTGDVAETMVADHDNDKDIQKLNDEGFDSDEPDLMPLNVSVDEQDGHDDEYVPPTPPSGSPKIFRPSGKSIFGSVAMPAAFRQPLLGFGGTFGTTSEPDNSSSRTNSAFGAISFSGICNHASSAFGDTNGPRLALGFRRGLWDDNWGEVEFTTLPASDNEDDGEPVAKKQKMLRVE